MSLVFKSIISRDLLISVAEEVGSCGTWTDFLITLRLNFRTSKCGNQYELYISLENLSWNNKKIRPASALTQSDQFLYSSLSCYSLVFKPLNSLEAQAGLSIPWFETQSRRRDKVRI